MLFKKWSKTKTPTTGKPSAIGTYNAGCLSGGVPVELNGSGYAIMRPNRRRNFALPEMKSYIETLGTQIDEKKMPMMLVGDVSPPRGGPMAKGHASHQIGLDVDIWFKMSTRRPSKSQRETWAATSFVKRRKTLRTNWSSAQEKLVELATTPSAVNRVFVSPAIKRHFCEITPTAPWLYKLRPWWGHEDHLHVRLNCPANNPTCTPQPPLNEKDNGCGEELAWWFSNEADEDWKKLLADKAPREFPELPQACVELGTPIRTTTSL